ncbi:MAG: hypothetical protein CMJ85_13815 [Planctomycetes bacterium]|nr:hypothetical protein [Planctomycetota bacterium]
MADAMHMLGGVDEAGLGPLLGPLVVGGLLLTGPEGKSPWPSLRKTFCKKPRSRKDRRIRIDDSKRVKQGGRGMGELERSALTMWYATHGELPRTVADVLAASITPFEATRYPWYADAHHTSLPRWCDGDSLELDAHVARRELTRVGIDCIAFPFRVVDVGTFNALIRHHDNKSLAHFDATLSIIAAISRAAHGARKDELADVMCTLVVDRQGGRERYADLLGRAFRGTDVSTLSEGPKVSRYGLGSHTEIVFAENGESRAFPTAAASCLAKYVRELCIERLNAWFTKRQPGLKPTAGYYSDGRRFLGEIEDSSAIPMELLVRIR